MRNRFLPRLAGALVLVAGLVLALLPTGPATPTPATAPVTVPPRLPGYSPITATVGAAPPGPALALYQHGIGVEFLDAPQAVVVGRDGGTTRRVDLAERSASPDSQGDPAPMLLAPDGAHVAIAEHASGDIRLLDLATAESVPLDVPSPAGSRPLAWSTDGRRLAHLVADGEPDPYAGAPVGVPAVLDLGSGTSTPLPLPADTWVAAFSADGDLAVQGTEQDASGWEPGDPVAGGPITVFGPDLVARDVLPSGGRVLAGPAAWSPDGALLATAGTAWEEPADVAFLAVDRSGADGSAAPGPVAAQWAVHAWLSPREIVVPAVGAGSTATSGPHVLERVDLTDGSREEYLRIPTSAGNAAVARLQLATAVLPGATYGPAERRDRGPWPLWAELALVGAAVLVAVPLTRAVLRRRSRATTRSAASR